MGIQINRFDNRFYPDPQRVIARFFVAGGDERSRLLIQKILKLSEEDCQSQLNRILTTYANRHRNITAVFEKHFTNIIHFLRDIGVDENSLSREKKLLVGSYFTHEYSIESAAFFNPCIMEDPNQDHLESGQKRVIVSFRATGEGHISSIVFRSGIIDSHNKLTFRKTNGLVEMPDVIKMREYDKKKYIAKLDELDIHKDIVDQIMDRLNDFFTFGDLQRSIHESVKEVKLSVSKKNVVQSLVWLADAHYDITFSEDTTISERVIFPVSSSERNGIEDARFVRFTGDDGQITYYATFTAYNGFAILPKMLETKDFYHFTIRPLHGKSAQNKGMALFPRKIRGQYVMVSRNDGYCNYLMYSDNLLTWQESIRIEEPEYPWEFVQIGNCGSPIETEKGWLLVTHGVGAMREYCLGLTLLDLEHPEKIICQYEEPILIPNDEEREGYVPNVVYSCGSMVHNNELIIPYGMSDSASSFASLHLDEILAKMTTGR
ncbi:MAG: glycoside hydrolase family 130 protein [Spirochaetales bacterium]|nr:glycoside hydrolase family 130 protein [Spirochaetales bacterium]